MIARVALKLLAANADVGFVRFVYGVSAPLVAPFQGIFPTPAGNGSVVELSSLVAIAVYAAVAWAIVRVVSILGRQQLPTTAGNGSRLGCTRHTGAIQHARVTHGQCTLLCLRSKRPLAR